VARSESWRATRGGLRCRRTSSSSSSHVCARHSHPARPHPTPPPRGGRKVPQLTVLAWLAKNPATFGQHFPEIRWDSARSQGTVLLSVKGA